jgi:hypothetical protein
MFIGSWFFVADSSQKQLEILCLGFAQLDKLLMGFCL